MPWLFFGNYGSPRLSLKTCLRALARIGESDKMIVALVPRVCVQRFIIIGGDLHGMCVWFALSSRS